MFENKKFNHVHYSRIIASWVRAGGKIDRRGANVMFRDWLEHIVIYDEKIPEDIREEIVYFATNGKCELEDDAEKFIANYSKIKD